MGGWAVMFPGSVSAVVGSARLGPGGICWGGWNRVSCTSALTEQSTCIAFDIHHRVDASWSLILGVDSFTVLSTPLFILTSLLLLSPTGMPLTATVSNDTHLYYLLIQGTEWVAA